MTAPPLRAHIGETARPTKPTATGCTDLHSLAPAACPRGLPAWQKGDRFEVPPRAEEVLAYAQRTGNPSDGVRPIRPP